MAFPRVLLAEDEQIVALDLRGILEQLGYEVVGCAATGEEAVELAVAHRPELIVMDVRLAGAVDGPEAAARIRETIDAPVVYVTAFSDEATLQRAKAGDPFGYVLKPFDERELRVTLDMALFKHRASRELRLHHAILENATDGMLILDPNHPERVIRYASPSFFRQTGYASEEVLGRRLDALLWDGVDDPAVEEVRAAVREGREYRGTVLTTKKDGSVFWNQLRIQPYVDGQSRMDLLVVVQTDVTEQLQAKEALKESEARFDEFMSTSLATAFIKDAEGRLIYANAAFLKALGLEAVDWRGKTVGELRPDAGGEDRDSEERILRTGVGEAVEESVQQPEGAHEWLTYKFRFLDSQGKPYIGGMGIEVTEQKRIERALRESEALLREAQRVAELGNWSVDVGTSRITWSEQMHQIFDVPMEVEPTFDLFMSRIHPEDRPAVQKILDETSRSMAKSYPLEYRLLLPSGEERRVFEYVRVERDGSGRPIRRFGTTQNVTRERRLDEERTRLEKQVQHAQKLESLGVLAGGIAHDFNNLLTGMLGYADLALTDLSPTSPAREHLEQIVLCARRAAELTRQMLAYSGKGRFVVQPVDLSEVVEDMAHLLEVSVSKRCVLRYRLAQKLPLVEADVSQIRQVLMNLIVNGSEAIGDRSGVIAVGTGAMDCDRSYLAESYLDENLPEGQYVYLEVADSGVGMTEETRRKIFDPFFTTKFTGRGLGLAAVLGIVRGHRGAIKVYSEPGRGTTFKVLFPVASQEAVRREVRKQEPPWQSQGLILVVDDEDTVRSMAGSMLRRMGFSVIFASTGLEAVDVFRTRSDEIRMVVLDLTMPQMDGEAAFRELRRIKPQVRVVLSSGYNEQDVTNRFAGKGLAGFIQKPYRLEELQTIVRRVLEPSGRAPSASDSG